MPKNSDRYRQPWAPVVVGEAQFAARWPDVWLRIERATAALQSDRYKGCNGFGGERVLACKHVLLGEPVRFACAEHPAAGVQCPRCAKRHSARHAPELETRCDACQASVDLIFPGAAAVPVDGLVVGDTQGRHRPLAGVVFLYCYGVCVECREAAA